MLAPTVPEIVRDDLRPLVEKFLAKHDLQLSDVRYWVAHPGGPKVLRALESALELDPERNRAHLGLTTGCRQLVVGFGAACFGQAARGTRFAAGPGAGHSDGTGVLRRAGALAVVT